MDTTASAVLDSPTRSRRSFETSPPRILVVDDEPALAELLSMAMRMEGWEVDTATDGFSGVRMARASEPDVVLLDVMMPGMGGFEALRRIRAADPGVPVMFLTACDAIEDRMAGFAAGGDDYVTKPFSLVEVVARVRALLRRTGMSTADTSVVTVGDLRLDEGDPPMIHTLRGVGYVLKPAC